MKFNRRTAKNQQDTLSDTAKGESILLYGNLVDKQEWLRKNVTLIPTMTSIIANNLTLRSSKRNFLSHLL
jgi:hypothetical protein